MFNKKIKCVCGKKIDAKYNFCPFCGRNLKAKLEKDKVREKEINGMIKQVEEAFNVPFLMKFPFEKLVKQMMKEVDKQFQEYDEQLANAQKEPNVVSSGISISINSSPEGQPVIEVKQFGQGQEAEKEIKPRKIKEEKIKKLPKARISEAEATRLAKLPRKEPETKVRRLTDKIVYEISLPGVLEEKNIIINKLQNSIEIKAFAKDKAYFKLIPLDLPIQNYKLEKEKLILELKP
ncbi:MAG: hypothetical protein ACPLXC_00210 [Candidatus Pacearchaeota archaeon]